MFDNFPNFFRYYDIVRDVRQNKGSILKASVDYIKRLKNDQHKKKALEEELRLEKVQNRKLLLKLQEYETQMKAYGIPLQPYAWKPATPTTTLFVNSKPVDKPTLASNGTGVTATLAAHARLATAAQQAMCDKPPISPTDPLDGVHMSTKELDDLMEDDCRGPVSNGDPMLSSPHLSPQGVMSSPASSSHYSGGNDDVLSPSDSMDLAA